MKKQSLILSVSLYFLLAACRVYAFGPPSIQYNDDGIQKYRTEDYGSAFDNFAKALSRDPFNPAFHLNLGDSFMKNGELPKAMSEFEAVEGSAKSTNEEKFKSMFNAGNAAIEGKDIPKALKYYQRALQYDPQSLETKTNIELALAAQNGGGGKGDKQDQNKDNKDNKDKKDQDQQGKDDKKDPNKDQKKDQNKDQKKEPDKGPGPKPTPHGFKSQALNENDVRRILEELKRQEEEIRAKQYKERRNTPEREIEKDW